MTETAAKPRGYFLAEREENGYHDSDFYDVVYFPPSAEHPNGEVERVDTHSTRWASMGPLRYERLPLPMLPEHEAGLRRWIYERKLDGMVAAFKDSLEPRGTHLKKGAPVVFVKEPRVRDASKPRARKGDTGFVVWSGAFGTFYRNGYKNPNDPSYIRVGVRLDRTGETVFAGATNLALDYEPDVAAMKAAAESAASVKPEFLASTATYLYAAPLARLRGFFFL